MFPVVLIFICMFNSTIYADRYQTINVEHGYDDKARVTTLKCNDQEFYLKENISTVIMLKGARVWKYKCSNNGKEWNVGKFEFKDHSSVAIVKQFFVQSSMLYNCKFYLHKDNILIHPQVNLEGRIYTELDCNFKIHIKQYWEELQVEINSEVKQTKLELNSKEVDVSYTYLFVEDELINVQCNKTKQVHGKLYFVYSGNNLTYSSPIEPANSVTFDIVLRAKQDKSYVDCVFYKHNSDYSYNVTLRIYFLLKRYPDEAVRVNGLAIRRKDLEYKTYDGDVPSVLCPGSDSPAELIYETRYLRNIANCTVDGETKKFTIYSSQPDNGVFITGLSTKNLLFRTWVKFSCIIYYEYADGEVVQLKGPDDRQLVCGQNDSIPENGIYEIQMKREVPRINVTCFIVGNESLNTTLIFHVSDERNDVSSQNTETGDDLGNSENANVIDDVNNGCVSNSDHEDLSSCYKIKSLKNYSLVIGIGLLIILSLLVLAIAVCILRKRRKPAAEGVQSNVDYVNLHHKNEPFPKHLNADVYLKPQEPSDYAVPVDNSIDTDLYSVPYKNKPNEELYSKPVPKNQRKHTNGEEVKYAALAFKDPPHTYSNVNKSNTECAYAQVHVRTEDLYAKVQLKAERGAGACQTNSTTADYVEPSYCEVGATKK